MPDVFGRIDQVYGGGLTADSLYMTFPDLPGSGLGLLIQQVALQYRQAVRRIFEIGPGVIPVVGVGTASGSAGGISADFCSSNTLSAQAQIACSGRAQPTYYIAARPEGTFNISRIFGPNAIGGCFYQIYGNPCNPNPDVTLSANAGCNGVQYAPIQYWDMHGFLITDLQMNVTAQEMIVQEGVQGMFIGLDMSPACPPPAVQAGAVQGAIGTLAAP